MKENKTPAHGGNRERAKVETATGQAAISCNHSTTAAATRQPRVSDILCRGKKNAQTMRELQRILDSDSRSIRIQIEHERRAGCPIVSNCKDGYWLAESRAEVEAFARSMERRASEIRRTAALVQLVGLDLGAGNGG